MELQDIKSSEDAKYAQTISNYWVESGDKVMFFVVDGNFLVFVFVGLALGSPWFYGFLGVLFVILLFLEKRDIGVFELLYRIRGFFLNYRLRRRF